ncbi:glycosylinositol phosphorylceramide mannosyl transferase 1-like [Silene latifolia]|uniref:glycosylinositol phosphorylceramide mannosyl transferase 1-like n=1 Tax=Silene latifolia TaxID=37657 RepID=UPI003D76D999
MSIPSIIAIRDAEINGNTGAFYSPAKEKAANRDKSPFVFVHRFAVFRRIRNSFKFKLLILVFFALCGVVLFASKFGPYMGWIVDSPSSVFSSSRGGYTVLINTWKRNSLLKQSVAHYASCHGTDAIHVVWSDSDPPPDSVKAYMDNAVKSQTTKPDLKFDVNTENNLNNRFKPIGDLRTDAIFSVDDDVIVPCNTLDFAFTMWQTAPSTMVGFVPRMHWLSEQQDGISYYKYGGWWSVWWVGTYSMVLTKAAFFHQKYLDMYTSQMPASIRDFIARERNCEDIAMSMLIANSTSAPPIWVKGKIYEIGSYGISSLGDHSNKRDKCLNDFVSLYGEVPLVSTNVKAVDSRNEWFW